MNNNWTYKKLGEVAETTSGGTPSKNHNEYYDGGTIPWLRSGEVSQGLIFDTELYITQAGLENSSAKIVPIDTVSIAMYGATVGEVGIIKAPMSTNQAICNILPNKNTKPEFLRYFLISMKPKYIEMANGGAQPNISQAIIRNTLIPIPPLSEQEAIVKELDLIHSIIDKKNEQLRELDNLAQSVFYTMFGDPIINDKNWEIKKLGEIAEQLFAGGDVPQDDCVKERDDKHQIPIFSNGVVKEGLYGFTSKARVEAKALTISARGTIGVIFKRENPFLPVVRLIVLIPQKDILSLDYTLFCLRALRIENNGVAIPQLTIPMLKKYIIPLPPLSLQQEFAKKVEAIEAQKELIRKSITEVETLLAARMQHYFG